MDVLRPAVDPAVPAAPTVGERVLGAMATPAGPIAMEARREMLRRAAVAVRAPAVLKGAMQAALVGEPVTLVAEPAVVRTSRPMGNALTHRPLRAVLPLIDHAPIGARPLPVPSPETGGSLEAAPPPTGALQVLIAVPDPPVMRVRLEAAMTAAPRHPVHRVPAVRTVVTAHARQALAPTARRPVAAPVRPPRRQGAETAAVPMAAVTGPRAVARLLPAAAQAPAVVRPQAVTAPVAAGRLTAVAIPDRAIPAHAPMAVARTAVPARRPGIRAVSVAISRITRPLGVRVRPVAPK